MPVVRVLGCITAPYRSWCSPVPAVATQSMRSGRGAVASWRYDPAMNDTPKLAKEIRVSDYGLTIDGEPFPWYISSDAISVEKRSGQPTTVTISLIAESVVTEEHGVRGITAWHSGGAM